MALPSTPSRVAATGPEIHFPGYLLLGQAFVPPTLFLPGAPLEVGRSWCRYTLLELLGT
jgi:hypothetical protein